MKVKASGRLGQRRALFSRHRVLFSP
ncbi:MAG: hypothetical protein RLZZ440_707, partial [Planctomycetota bacterium]